MSSSDPSSLSGFSGVVRLFPLPNLVLFPNIIQPLHIFEPRYRRLLADALADDRLMALALLRPGWEDQYHQSPPIHDVVCLGKIFQEEQLPDGRSNLLLQGLCRARIRQEIQEELPYRRADVEILRDVPVASGVTEHLLREELGNRLREWFAAQPAALAQLRKLLQTEMPLATLCDMFGFALDLPLAHKQQLLEEANVERRTRALLEQLEGKQAPAGLLRRFPVEFSIN
jgi:Lon protease-like protein